MDNKVTVKGKEFEIPERIGQLPAGKVTKFYSKVGKLSEDKMAYYNFYLFEMLFDMSAQEVEEMPFEEYIEILGKVNKMFSQKTSDNKLKTEVDIVPEEESKA